MSLIGLLVRGREYQSTSFDGASSTMIHPFATIGSHQQQNGQLNEWPSGAVPVLQEPFESRPAAPPRRRYRMEESGSRHGRSVRHRALRALLDSVLGDVSDDYATDLEARRG